MKKLLALGACAFAFSVTPALADHHEGGDHKGKMFEKHDTNGDGVISKDEFLTHAAEKAEERFAKMDADGNGEVSKEEAAAAKEKWREKMKEYKEKRKEKAEDGQDDTAEE